jgi:hypothetical protein
MKLECGLCLEIIDTSIQGNFKCVCGNLSGHAGQAYDDKQWTVHWGGKEVKPVPRDWGRKARYINLIRRYWDEQDRDGN